MTTASPEFAGPRRSIASFGSYEDAQRTVDMLADRRFPVERVAIIGTGLRLVEVVTGRLTIWRVALAGAATGAWIGLLVGLVFWIVSPWALGAVLSGVLVGLVFGAFWGAIAHALTRGRRDFASLRGLEADRYDVVVDESHAEEALRVLSGPTTPDGVARDGVGTGAMPPDPATTDRPAAHRAGTSGSTSTNGPSYRDDRL
jgi:hypothetical protein